MAWTCSLLELWVLGLWWIQQQWTPSLPFLPPVVQTNISDCKVAEEVPSTTPAVTSAREAVTSSSQDHQHLWVRAFRLWTPKQRGKVQTEHIAQRKLPPWAVHFVLIHPGVNTQPRLSHSKGLLSRLGCVSVNLGPAGISLGQIID